MILLYLTLLLTLQFGIAAFSPNSFLVVAHAGSDHYLYEYDLNGNKLQEINMNVTSQHSQSHPTIYLDESGLLLSYCSYNPDHNTAYTIGANGQIMHTTLLSPGIPICRVVTSDHDIWFGRESITKTKLGSNTTMTSDPLTKPFSVNGMQSVDNTIYVLDGNTLMSINTEGGEEKVMLNDVKLFYVHKYVGTSLYVYCTSGDLVKYYVFNGRLSESVWTLRGLTGIESLIATYVNNDVTNVLVRSYDAENTAWTVMKMKEFRGKIVAKDIIVRTKAAALYDISMSPQIKTNYETDVRSWCKQVGFGISIAERLCTFIILHLTDY